MNTTLAKVEPSHLAAVERPVSMLQFTPEQSQIIRDMCANGATESEFTFLMEIAKARGMNPLLKQIYFVKRWDSSKKREVWSAQVGIDGFRSIAERTGLYDGQDEPEYGPLNNSGFPQWAKVKVYKKGVSRPFVGTAYWAEFVQLNKEGNPTKFWIDMPMNQLAKCAESLALRKGFPEELGGLHTPDEMGQSENDRPRQLGPHSPHGYNGESATPQNLDPDIAADLAARMKQAEDMLEWCDSYDKLCALRALLGDSKNRSKLTLDIQAAFDPTKDSSTWLITPELHRELGRQYRSMIGKCKTLEKKLAPPAEDSFTDGPEVDADSDGDGR